jgi:hypothetical protein
MWANIHTSLRTQTGTFFFPHSLSFSLFFFFWHSLDYLLHTRFARGGHSWHYATRGERAQQACRSREEALRPTWRPHTLVAWGRRAHATRGQRAQLACRSREKAVRPNVCMHVYIHILFSARAHTHTHTLKVALYLQASYTSPFWTT